MLRHAVHASGRRGRARQPGARRRLADPSMHVGSHLCQLGIIHRGASRADTSEPRHPVVSTRNRVVVLLDLFVELIHATGRLESRLHLMFISLLRRHLASPVPAAGRRALLRLARVYAVGRVPRNSGRMGARLDRRSVRLATGRHRLLTRPCRVAWVGRILR